MTSVLILACDCILLTTPLNFCNSFFGWHGLTWHGSHLSAKRKSVFVGPCSFISLARTKFRLVNELQTVEHEEVKNEKVEVAMISRTKP